MAKNSDVEPDHLCSTIYSVSTSCVTLGKLFFLIMLLYFKNWNNYNINTWWHCYEGSQWAGTE